MFFSFAQLSLFEKFCKMKIGGKVFTSVFERNLFFFCATFLFENFLFLANRHSNYLISRRCLLLLMRPTLLFFSLLFLLGGRPRDGTLTREIRSPFRIPRDFSSRLRNTADCKNSSRGVRRIMHWSPVVPVVCLSKSVS